MFKQISVNIHGSIIHKIFPKGMQTYTDDGKSSIDELFKAFECYEEGTLLHISSKYFLRQKMYRTDP